MKIRKKGKEAGRKEKKKKTSRGNFYAASNSSDLSNERIRLNCHFCILFFFNQYTNLTNHLPEYF